MSTAASLASAKKRRGASGNLQNDEVNKDLKNNNIQRFTFKELLLQHDNKLNKIGSLVYQLYNERNQKDNSEYITKV